MFELFCKSAVIFATCLFIDTLLDVEIIERPLLKVHSHFGRLTFKIFCSHVIFNSAFSYILLFHIPYHTLLYIAIPTIYIPYIVTLWSTIIGGYRYTPHRNNYIKVYHYIHAASIGYFCANMINDNQYTQYNQYNYNNKIIILIAMHDTMCGIYWFIIGRYYKLYN
jgi:hypothetical protein